MRASLKSTALLLIAIGLLACATLVHAQANQDELHATIMAALLSDPRTATVPPAQLQALVNALSEQAASQGLLPQEIKWQVAAAAETFGQNGASQGGQCGGLFPSLCAFSEAFGFTGADASTPIILFVTSVLLLFLLYEIIKHHRMKLDAKKAASPASNPEVAQ